MFRTPALRATLALAFLAAAAPGLAAQTIRGVLMDADTDRPIDLGLVMMFTVEGDSVTQTITNPEGYFTLTSPEPGSFLLLAGALGYKETPAGVFDLGEDGEMTVEYRIAPEPLPIDEIVVNLSRPVLEHKLVRNGFVRRYQRGLGHFITPHDIENSYATSTEQLFANVPDVIVRPSSGLLSYLGDQVVFRNRAGTGGIFCNPTVFVDGARVPYNHTDGVTLSMIVPLESVEAAEVYRSAAEIPPEYNISQTGSTNCGVLVIWTRSR